MEEVGSASARRGRGSLAEEPGNWVPTSTGILPQGSTLFGGGQSNGRHRPSSAAFLQRQSSLPTVAAGHSSSFSQRRLSSEALFDAPALLSHASEKSESVEQWVLHAEGNKSRFPYLEQPNDRAYNASSAARHEGGASTGTLRSPANSSKPPSGRTFVATPTSIFNSRPNSAAAASEAVVQRTVISSAGGGGRVTYHGARSSGDGPNDRPFSALSRARVPSSAHRKSPRGSRDPSPQPTPVDSRDASPGELEGGRVDDDLAHADAATRVTPPTTTSPARFERNDGSPVVPTTRPQSSLLTHRACSAQSRPAWDTDFSGKLRPSSAVSTARSPEAAQRLTRPQQRRSSAPKRLSTRGDPNAANPTSSPSPPSWFSQKAPASPSLAGTSMYQGKRPLSATAHNQRSPSSSDKRRAHSAHVRMTSTVPPHEGGSSSGSRAQQMLNNQESTERGLPPAAPNTRRLSINVSSDTGNSHASPSSTARKQRPKSPVSPIRPLTGMSDLGRRDPGVEQALRGRPFSAVTSHFMEDRAVALGSGSRQVTVLHPNTIAEQQDALRHTENRPLEYVSIARQPVYDEAAGDIRTSHAVLDYYAKHGHTAEKKLFYLNRAPPGEGVTPYDLIVVPLEKRDPKEHYCMSAMGVVTVIEGYETEFCLLGEWIEEESRYHMVRQMRFFKYFLHSKFLRVWRAQVRAATFRKAREKLKTSLLRGRATFIKPLQEIMTLAYEIDVLPLIVPLFKEKLREDGWHKEHRCMKLPDFLAENERHREEAARAKLEEVVEGMQAVLERICDEVITTEHQYRMSVEPELADRNGIALDPGNKHRSLHVMKQEREQRIQIYFGWRADKAHLPTLIRLTDRILCEKLAAAVLHAASHVDEFLHLEADKAEKVKKGCFTTRISYSQESEDFDYEPNSDAILEGIRETLQAAVDVAGSTLRPILLRNNAQYLGIGPIKGPNVVTMCTHDEGYIHMVSRIEDALADSWDATRPYAEQKFRKQRSIFEFGLSWNPAEFADKVLSREEFESNIRRIAAWKKEAESSTATGVKGVLHIDSRSLRDGLVEVTARALDDMKGALARRAAVFTSELLDEARGLTQWLDERPSDLDGFAAFKRRFSSAGESISSFDKKKDDVLGVKDKAGGAVVKKEQLGMYGLLKLHEYKLGIQEQVAVDNLEEAAARLHESIEGAANHLVSMQQAQNGELDTEVAHLQEDLLETVAAINAGPLQTVKSDVGEMLQLLDEFGVKIERYEKDAARFKEYQGLFRMTVDSFSNLDLVRREYEKNRAIWDTLSEWERLTEEWRTARTDAIDLDDLQAKADEYARSVYKMNKMYKGHEVCEKAAALVEAHKPYLPLYAEVANPALTSEHWREIFEAIGAPQAYVPGSTPVVTDLVELGILDHLEQVANIGGAASKQYSMLQALEKMVAAWRGMEFHCAPYKGGVTGAYVLGATEEVQALLDDQLMKVQAMNASPYVKPFKERATEWQRTIFNLQELLDNWIVVQSTWLYLEPIFSSEDIVKQMPEEGEKFSQVDTAFTELMSAVASAPAVIPIAQQDEHLETLIRCNKLLEEVQKGLSSYLEKKRLYFPRFFFLSNDEMLEILSETKDPTRVQPHLKKCFEGISKLDFGPDLAIRAMVSAEAEVVRFKEPISTRAANGKVEEWLYDVEEGMFASIHDVTAKGLSAYAAASRSQWVLEWPGMVVLLVTLIYWTRGAEAALDDGTLAAYERACTEGLMDIVAMVRGELTTLQRATLGALVVTDVHARDVVADLVKQRVDSAAAFSWQAQLRAYWEEDIDSFGRVSERGHTAMMRMMNAEIAYGYEYLGNSSRLVITPLTDRCYRTLMGAIHLTLGGAPEGPAGTGKTETTKDLAKAMARQCVVFNCSDSLDYIAMGKFFKGLASSGAWACFDEFNRIDLEVLSVVAQQVMDIQRAIRGRLTQFIFEGTEMTLKWTAWCSITMNPGYAGRSELPDNLKALFRTVAMMVPDYAMISEIILFSYGYLAARDAAKKIVQCYKLCSEQLSSQDHYDYGMRAVIAVLRAAGNLKRAFPSDDEFQLMLRSIVDVNLCKFLSHDIALFRGILSDLFPGVDLPDADYRDMEAALREEAAELGLQVTPYFRLKVTQLYEMVCVRHGLMLVGQPLSGKTAAYRALGGALSRMSAAGLGNQQPATWTVINPKALTMGQLYGAFDPVSHEWSDGVLAVKFREFASDPSPGRKWLVLDGPVDAIWIENMNTVLDDNKKLCLNSGEIIAMSSPMSLLFEVADLAVASPATVSRCGMVYMEPSELGWAPFLDSWTAGLPLPPSLTGRLAALFRLLGPVCLRFVRREVTEVTPTQDSALMASGMRLLQGLMTPLLPQVEESGDTPAISDALESLLLFSLVWSVGASASTQEGRAAFDALLRTAAAGHLRKNDGFRGPSGEVYNTPEDIPDVDVHLVAPMMPAEQGQTVYDFYFDLEKRAWTPWADTLDKTPIPPEAAVRDIIVPTVDTARYTFLLSQAVEFGYGILLVGPTGTGKSAYTRRFLAGLPPDRYVPPNCVTFSAQTTANMTQYLVDAKLDKRRKGLFGPPMGKRAIIFVDDLNMPALEEYGAQPPVELLRQFLDHGGWYGRDNSFRAMADCQLLAAMAPPGGARSAVTPRFVRHMNVCSVVEFDDDAMRSIFHTILQWDLRCRKFSPRVVEVSEEIVNATLTVYKTVQDALLPTPTKSFYLFNLRDMARVVAGLTMLAPRSLGSKEGARDAYLRAWVHELLRVFYDRLVDEADQGWFLDLLRTVLHDTFEVELDELLQRLRTEDEGAGKIEPVHLRTLFFGDYHREEVDEVTGQRPYCEVTDPDALIPLMEEFLADYNGMARKGMSLAIFLYAVEHLSRLARILRQPGGHALCVGLGGSGRQSLSRLAAFINGMVVHQVQITKSYGQDEWREDLKRICKSAGAEDRPAVFLFSDTQIKRETFVEDINNLLNSGEVPNMFPYDERAAVIEATRVSAGKRGRALEGAQELWDYFVGRTAANLHLIICLSPVGDAFRERLRRFPALVNCCTIDWFARWPPEALQAVAAQFTHDIDLPDALRPKIITACRAFHQDAGKLCERFRAETGRVNYVTPTSYVELICSFKALLAAKRSEVLRGKGRYEAGLAKIDFSAGQIATMQEELAVLKPGLEAAMGESEALMERVAREKREVVEPKKEVVDRDVRAADAKAAEAAEIKGNCEAILAEAMPILNAAIRALDTIKPADIKLVESFKSPPATVKLVMEAVCVMLGEKPTPKADPDNPGKKIMDYWETSRRVLKEPGMVERLKGYDRDNINAKIIDKIRREYMTNPDFTPASAAKASSACEGMCRWIHAMDKYEEVAKVVAPKQAALAEAQAEYETVMSSLRAKQSELDTIMAELAALEEQLAATVAEKNRLESEVELCAQKLERAEKLIGGLGGERERWGIAAAELGARFDLLTGDMLLAAGAITYLGAFTASYRDSTLTSWAERCSSDAIPASPVFSLESSLGDPVQIREWAIAGLPSDSFSIANAIMVANSRRWPLMIDPQGQANKWVKQMAKSLNVQVIKLTDSDYMRTMENAIQFGLPVLLENVKEELDPSLEPILQRQTFRSGGVTSIQLGDTVMEYNDSFRFYMTTALRNPHYLPETSVKVMLLNFMITAEGLADQLVGVVVTQERPDLEAKRAELVISSAANKRKLKEIEDRILATLSASEGNILEDASAIQILSEAKVVADDISEKEVVAEATAAEIGEATRSYTPAGAYNAVLFFCVADMGAIDPMYQYSLPWFLALFVRSIRDSRPPTTQDGGDGGGGVPETPTPERLDQIAAHFTLSLYGNVCHSLFEKDKLLFSFLLATRLMASRGALPPAEYHFLLTGGTGPPTPRPPDQDWISAKMWSELGGLAALGDANAGGSATLAELPSAVASSPREWKKIFDSSEPHAEPLPGEFDHRVTPFQRLCILRCLRPDRVVMGIQALVEAELGPAFVQPPAFSLAGSYSESAAERPLLFVLSPGSDPTASLLKFAEDRGMASRMWVISMGQGQGPKAAALINDALGVGGWVLLQNCHLAPSWMPALEKIYEGIKPESVDANFRLWMTSMPSAAFPVTILQNSVKMVTEPPAGIRANMGRALALDPISNPEWFESSSKPAVFKKLLFGLCFIHAFVLERRRFGPIGWNIPYSFDDGDLRISARQLLMYTEENDAVPFDALKYSIGECNYGGRVTDDKDRRLLNTLLDLLYQPPILQSGFKLCASGDYVVPPDGSLEDYLAAVRSLPAVQRPEAFGLHDNADISKDLGQTAITLGALLEVGGGGAGGGLAGREAAVGAMADDILRRLPPPFDVEKAALRYPVRYEESLNQVLCQEMLRFNRLTAVIRTSLAALRKAVAGLQVMAAETEGVLRAMSLGAVPAHWRAKSYPSLRPLAGYIDDLLHRLAMLEDWYHRGPPVVFWLPGFFFTPSFTTAALQNYARRKQLAIDSVGFDFEAVGMDPSALTAKPPDGVYVHGMFLEGCGWDARQGRLTESAPKVLHDPTPVIWLRPRLLEEMTEYPHYECPMYRTGDRRGVLATTGHSTNFVMFVRLPSDKPQAHWIMRGVCMLLSLND